jgi:hypothetical protein
MKNTGTFLTEHPYETSAACAAMQAAKLRPSKSVSLPHGRSSSGPLKTWSFPQAARFPRHSRFGLELI